MKLAKYLFWVLAVKFTIKFYLFIVFFARVYTLSYTRLSCYKDMRVDCAFFNEDFLLLYCVFYHSLTDGRADDWEKIV